MYIKDLTKCTAPSVLRKILVPEVYTSKSDSELLDISTRIFEKQ